MDLSEPSSPVCRGVHLNRNDSRASERWSRRKKLEGEREREREREREWAKGREGNIRLRRNARYHCPLYIQEHNLTKLLAHSDLLPPRGTGSFLIHVSDGVTLRPPILLLLAPFNAPDEPSHCARFQLWIPSDVSFLRSTWAMMTPPQIWFESSREGKREEKED